MTELERAAILGLNRTQLVDHIASRLWDVLGSGRTAPPRYDSRDWDDVAETVMETVELWIENK
jgi:hypothetical protein